MTGFSTVTSSLYFCIYIIFLLKKKAFSEVVMAILGQSESKEVKPMQQKKQRGAHGGTIKSSGVFKCTYISTILLGLCSLEFARGGLLCTGMKVLP